MTEVRDREQGFALLEMVVAMAIISLALATFYRTSGGAFRAASRVQTLQTTIVFARSQLDAVGSDGLLETGTTSGVYQNGVRWQLSVADLTNGLQTANALRPYWITLIAKDRSGAPLIKLETAKVAREPQS